MTPAELGYCIKGYDLRRKMQDNDVWEYFGTYGISAVMTAVEHCLAGQQAVLKYVDKPNTLSKAENAPLTEEEKMKQVDMFFAQEEARKISWRKNHKKNTEHGGNVS